MIMIMTHNDGSSVIVVVVVGGVLVTLSKTKHSASWIDRVTMTNTDEAMIYIPLMTAATESADKASQVVIYKGFCSFKAQIETNFLSINKTRLCI